MLDFWTDWRPFPDPRLGQLLVAPFGPGVFDLRIKSSEENILFGVCQSVASRMTTLIPHDIKTPKYASSSRRRFLVSSLALLEYRTISCRTRADAERAAQALDPNTYRYVA
jgi:hypothetical protein